MTARPAHEEAERLSMLRMHMLEMHPFWAYLLLQVKLIPAPRLQAFAATDCVRHIWYNPELTRHLGHRQLGFVLAHEVCHQLLASMPRQRGRNHHLWNCATDYAINRIVASIDDLVEEGSPMYRPPDVKLPGIGQVEILLDERFDGMIAETIYEHLLAEELPLPCPVSVVLPPADNGKGGVDVKIPGVGDHRGGVDIHLPDTLTPADREELADRIGAAVEVWQRGGERGHVPGELVREIDRRRKPKLPWRRLLRRYGGQALAKDDYSQTRPNKRYLADDLVVPGLHSDRVGRIVVAVDTSASIEPELLDEILAEVAALADEAEEITVIIADAEVHEVVSGIQLPGYLRKGRVSGGGGTDHLPVFRHIDKHRLQPDLFVGLTDLFTCLPLKQPPYPVIWVVPSQRGQAPWGRVVVLEDSALSNC